MINILVRLEVKDFECLNEFESFALKIMERYQGRLLSAFEIEETMEGKREEIHILEFPDEAHFKKYREDGELANKSELRNKAISKTTVSISTKLKSYG
ncbi:DUF1330 domain-containing protein [Bermanella marisrubri]|uniref:DUF1330 domain-containing protein n=1 Tax=Bermanella marisrubri TaxID=207949 RepID=Q1N6J3_9GAMM|nr:DUF1330 domain-containing protein [Bermanella marisrubri]EAT13599.1 hypothetical protein RED65_09414 [Oceanobacter sp. RED65] [Bermanella marisrubri]QIZ84387.1 DUF1330 domain-containing protein [Bermanella marisrubri]